MLEGRPNFQPSRYLPICGEVGDPNSDSEFPAPITYIYFFKLFVFLKSCEKNISICANNGRLHAIYLFRIKKCLWRTNRKVTLTVRIRIRSIYNRNVRFRSNTDLIRHSGIHKRRHQKFHKNFLYAILPFGLLTWNSLDSLNGRQVSEKRLEKLPF